MEFIILLIIIVLLIGGAYYLMRDLNHQNKIANESMDKIKKMVESIETVDDADNVISYICEHCNLTDSLYKNIRNDYYSAYWFVKGIKYAMQRRIKIN